MRVLVDASGVQRVGGVRTGTPQPITTIPPPGGSANLPGPNRPVNVRTKNEKSPTLRRGADKRGDTEGTLYPLRGMADLSGQQWLINVRINVCPSHGKSSALRRGADKRENTKEHTLRNINFENKLYPLRGI